MSRSRPNPVKQIANATKKELDDAMVVKRKHKLRELRSALLQSIEKFPDKQHIVEKFDALPSVGYLNAAERRYLISVVYEVVFTSIQSEFVGITL